MIRVNHLQKTFKHVKALDDVCFEAPNGEITGLLGPNGAGKTTTLRILYGLLSADQGSVEIDDCNALEAPLDAQERLGVLPDSSGLHKRLTAREHVTYFGHLRGLQGPGLKERVRELIELLEMDKIADRRAEGFSQGERLKVSIARALVHDPPNLILDEPTNGLDVVSTRALRKLIKAQRDMGKCVVFSSHIMQEVAALCDRIVIMAAGRVVAEGTPARVLAQANTDDLEDAFVALTRGGGVR